MAEIYEKGQVVIPKHLRDEFRFYPGTKVAFRREREGVLVMPACNVQEEMEKLRAQGATLSDEETRSTIAEMRKKWREGMANVPRL